MALVRKRPPPISAEDLRSILAAKSSAQQSWGKYRKARVASKQPAHKNRLSQLQRRILGEECVQSRPMRSVRGAFFPLLEILARTIDVEIYRGNIAPDAAHLTCKISLDGRKLRGNHNFALFVSYVESAKAQSNRVTRMQNGALIDVIFSPLLTFRVRSLDETSV